ncbi:glycoside hydrolase domain-containing protein [Sporolactobacillus vineae]|uniref:glycoside hydrolase domain-containing protein n=1 Tax=Sporolactobacillus vineae TaxID=444463 RepID=UPI000287A43F|nr:glycoside hydrolase domain-containing protein [Sporolactobacillus vineae]
MKAIDCATKLTEDAIGRLRQTGVGAIGRYLGPEHSWKSVDNQEAKVILAAGLGLFSIWETNPVKRAYFTEAQAKKDAAAAERYAAAIGQPPGTPIYFTVDYNAGGEDLGTIINYFRRIRGIRYRIGAYGSFRVVEAVSRAKAADFFYQTYAWSEGRLSACAHIYQYRNDRILSGVRVDDDLVLKPDGIWPADTGKNKSSTRIPGKAAPAAKKNISSGSVPYPGHLVREGSRGDAVRRIQHIAGAAEDGLFGPQTRQAVRNWQKKHGLKPDGIVGPLTWNAMF